MLISCGRCRAGVFYDERSVAFVEARADGAAKVVRALGAGTAGTADTVLAQAAPPR